MLTAYRLPLHKGDWVYLTEVIDGNPVGTYGKFEKYDGEVMIMHPKMGKPIRVRPDHINKLSIEEVRSRDEKLMLIEANIALPALTVVQFYSAGIGASRAWFTADGIRSFEIRYSNLMRVIEKESDNPVEWFIQHATLPPSPLLEISQVYEMMNATGLEILRGTFWKRQQLFRDEVKKIFIKEIKADRDHDLKVGVMGLLKDIEDYDHPNKQEPPEEYQNPVVSSIIYTLRMNMKKDQVIALCSEFTAALIENDPELTTREIYWVWSRINHFYTHYADGPVNEALKKVLDAIEDLLPVE